MATRHDSCLHARPFLSIWWLLIYLCYVNTQWQTSYLYPTPHTSNGSHNVTQTYICTLTRWHNATYIPCYQLNVLLLSLIHDFSLHIKLLSNELWLKPEIEIEEYVPKSQKLARRDQAAHTYRGRGGKGRIVCRYYHSLDVDKPTCIDILCVLTFHFISKFSPQL